MFNLYYYVHNLHIKFNHYPRLNNKKTKKKNTSGRVSLH